MVAKLKEENPAHCNVTQIIPNQRKNEPDSLASIMSHRFMKQLQAVERHSHTSPTKNKLYQSSP